MKAIKLLLGILALSWTAISRLLRRRDSLELAQADPRHDAAGIAACKFKEGDRVRMTKRARKMFYARPSEVGEVVGTYPCGAAVWFQGKGVRHSFHQDFLEKVEGRHDGGKIRHQTSSGIKKGDTVKLTKEAQQEEWSRPFRTPEGSEVGTVVYTYSWGARVEFWPGRVWAKQEVLNQDWLERVS